MKILFFIVLFWWVPWNNQEIAQCWEGTTKTEVEDGWLNYYQCVDKKWKLKRRYKTRPKKK